MVQFPVQLSRQPSYADIVIILSAPFGGPVGMTFTLKPKLVHDQPGQRLTKPQHDSMIIFVGFD